MKKGLFNGLYFEVAGNGEPIIFLHGIGANHHMFEPQVQELSKQYTTITIDLKGSGNSESPSSWKYVDIHIQSILDLINYLEIEKVTFMGVSYGGIITQLFAIRHPEKVKRMILVDTFANTKINDKTELKMLPLAVYIATISWLPKRMAPFWCKPMKRWELAYNESVEILKQARAKDVSLQLLEVFGLNLLNELQKLRFPSLVIVGDFLEGAIKKAEEITKHLPNSKLVVVKDSFDPTNLCQPHKVNEIVSDFLVGKAV